MPYLGKVKIRFIDIIFGLAVITADLFVYIFLGILLMGYDDNYNISKGEYWSLASMNSTEKVLYYAFHLWNIINIAGVVCIGYRIYKIFKNRT